MLARRLFLLAAVMMTAATASAQPRAMTDTEAIRHVIKATWDRPAAAVEVSPVMIVSDYAVAGWTQEANGGRALLRKRDGAWAVILCAGDQLRQAETLRRVGMPARDAERLAADLAQAESAMPRERVTMFSRFEGLVTIDGAGGPGHHHR